MVFSTTEIPKENYTFKQKKISGYKFGNHRDKGYKRIPLIKNRNSKI